MISSGEHREIVLLEELKKRHRLDVEEALHLLKVSEATLRRLFAKLEAEHKLIRTHGGVQALPLPQGNYSFEESSQRSIEYKSQIGKAALARIDSGDRIFLDAGTTVMYLAEELSLPLRLGTLRNLTVVTSSLSLAGSIAPYCEVILIGGRMRPERNDVCGALACENLRRYQFDKVFLGVDGITADGRLMTTDQETAAVNTTFLALAKTRIVLADAEKFDRTSFIAFATLAQVDMVITDRRVERETLRRYAKFPAEIKLAE